VNPPLLDVAAFHCQQAAEKLLKGFLVHASVDFGKMHDLEKLGQSSSSPSLQSRRWPCRWEIVPNGISLIVTPTSWNRSLCPRPSNLLMHWI
jgi:hypothetical protein